ncbi:hypothetical protein F5B19DRAFT_93755 [Rostrohypoxylon terebratum]|nr:hypothetical protein F5B19DRAFT_93755 [Rostrohypoxylon terebratum]
MSTNSGTPPTSFTCFPNLPPELRIKIWHETFKARAIEVHLQHFFGSLPVADCTTRWTSHCSNPVALFVCLESRKVACDRFPVILPIFGFGPKRDTIPRHIRFNPASDVLAIRGQLKTSRITELLQAIRLGDTAGREPERICISLNFFRPRFQIEEHFVRRVHVTRHLKELVLRTYTDEPLPANFGYGKYTLTEVPGMNLLSKAFTAYAHERSKTHGLRHIDVNFILDPAFRAALTST